MQQVKLTKKKTERKDKFCFLRMIAKPTKQNLHIFGRQGSIYRVGGGVLSYSLIVAQGIPPHAKKSSRVYCKLGDNNSVFMLISFPC